MLGIFIGSVLIIDAANDEELVTVTAVSSTTFTASFEFDHTGPFTVLGLATSARWPGVVCNYDPITASFSDTDQTVWIAPPNGEYLGNAYTDTLENFNSQVYYRGHLQRTGQ